MEQQLRFLLDFSRLLHVGRGSKTINNLERGAENQGISINLRRFSAVNESAARLTSMSISRYPKLGAICAEVH